MNDSLRTITSDNNLIEEGAVMNNGLETQVERGMKQLQKNWQWYFVLGIGLVILGTLMVMFAATSTLFSIIYLGAFFVSVGIFEGIKSIKINQWGSFFLHLLLSVLYIFGGVYMLLYPMVNAMTLTLFLAFFFIVSGIFRLVVVFTQSLPHKEWVAINGILTIVLGILIWQQWPASGLWAIGMLVGIDVLFTGWTWIMLSIRAKNLAGN